MLRGVVVMVLGTGCVLAPMGGAQRPSTPPPAGSSAPSSGTEPAGAVYHMDHGADFVGMPVADARAAAAQAGWTGTVEVYEETYDARCPAGAVCRFAPTDWKIKVGTMAQLYFYVNPALTISAPPPPQ